MQLRLFYDLKPNGSLCQILLQMYKIKSEHGARRFDLQSPSKKDANVDLCLKVM